MFVLLSHLVFVYVWTEDTVTETTLFGISCADYFTTDPWTLI
jgi:hypothetical protein